MRLEIDRIAVKRFKGVDDLEIELGGLDATVRGDNATGKTTIADAWSWLLWGKDSRGRTDFAIKRLDAGGEPEHGVDHSVSATVRHGDRGIVLSRTYRELWQKRRGSPHAVMTGHETVFEVDGVPTTKAEYDATVSAIADETTWRVLTDPTFFSDQLPWKDRRAMLLSVTGDVDDRAVIDSDPELAELADVVDGGRTIEQHRKVCEAERKKVNVELEKLPVRIDEVRRTVADDGVDWKAAKAAIAEAREGRRRTAEKLTRLESGGEVAELTKKLREAEAEAQAEANRLSAGHETALAAVRTVHGVALEAAEAAKRKLASLDAEERAAAAEAKKLAERRDELLAEWQSVDAEELGHREPDTCAACGQKLPPEKVEAARKRAIEELNASKARRLAEVSDAGKRARARLDWLTGQDAECRSAEREAAAARLAAAREERDETKAELDRLRSEAVPVPSGGAAQEIRDRIAALGGESSAEVEAARAEVARLEHAIDEAETALARAERTEEARGRIRQLEHDERRLAVEHEALLRQVFLCDQFVRAKVALLEEAVNSRFELARFKLFRELVNGGVEPCCETTFEGVPYNAGLNAGARVNVGLDVIRTISRATGFAPPIFLDQAESTTSYVETDSQTVYLEVAAECPALEVQVGEAAIALGAEVKA
jgi:hypothetical protein